MRTRQLRSATGSLPPSLLGFGGAPLGNLYVAITEEQAAAALDGAWEAGIRMFDTAPLYGFGLSEERFARAHIPPALWSDLKSEGLIRPNAPVPTGPFT